MTKRFIAISMCIIVMISCRNKENRPDNVHPTSIDIKQNKHQDSLVLYNKSINKDAVLKEDIERLISSGSPLGVHLQTNFGSESEYFKFGKDSLVWHSWGNQLNCRIGKWYMEGNNIMIR